MPPANPFGVAKSKKAAVRREDDILPYEDKTNRRAFFPASGREGDHEVVEGAGGYKSKILVCTAHYPHTAAILWPPLCKGRWHFRKKMTEGLCPFSLTPLHRYKMIA